MASSATEPVSVAQLFQECSVREKAFSRNAIDRLKSLLAQDLTFRGKLFDAFSARPLNSSFPDADLAARYQALVESFRKTRQSDERLNLFAQWLWAELGITPDESLGKAEVKRLSLEARRRVAHVEFNSLYYAGLVQIWLIYSGRLFRDARAVNESNPEKRLRRLGYDSSAVEIFILKRWRSEVEFTCEWLATRGRIEMVKPRADLDAARTLRNAYTKIFGRSAPRFV
jgi:hypothetical protein